MTSSEQQLVDPRRDVDDGDHECQHCGGAAHSLIGYEHIWKCSEVVPKEVLRDVVGTLRFDRAQRAGMGGHDEAATAYEDAADVLEEVINGGE